ncbi:putative oxalocrotonate tautomerase [Dendryphion nanum]|uniref:Oxalocrotonate tautomerase n=1 Tax=Dendryphion nanum TaxID=256645 RepID=A0A9P9EKA8_9PLEO|nr:putative oxalocrotonate tautomerase [Dendryphion nanum]
MPLWNIYHPEGTFEDNASKEAFAKDITVFYTNIGLPAFYVVGQFIKLPTNSIVIGGKILDQKTPFVRITIDHIAVRLPNEDQVYKRTREGINQILKKHIFDKGWDGEFHVNETERKLWMVNGLYAPPFGSEEEKAWTKANKALPWDGMNLP